MLRCMSKAVYEEKPKGHYGLVLKDYAHFTSPIRRYPDLAIHRIMTAQLKGMDKDTMVLRYSDFAYLISAFHFLCNAFLLHNLLREMAGSPQLMCIHNVKHDWLLHDIVFRTS